MRRSPHRAIAGISELDSRVDLIARAAHRPEHNDDILTLRPRLMTFRIRAVEQRFARKGEQQHGPRGAGGRPVTRRLYLRVTCSEPLSILFLVHVEGFTLLSPSTRERSVSEIRDPLSAGACSS